MIASTKPVSVDKLKLRPRNYTSKYAALTASVEALKPGEAITVQVPKGKTADEWRNQLGVRLRAKLEHLSWTFKTAITADGQVALSRPASSTAKNGAAPKAKRTAKRSKR